MTKPPKTWKHVEAEIARFWPGAKRRGADYGDKNGGKNDILTSGWSIEVKHSRRPTWGLMTGAVAQAENNRDQPGDIPVAVIHPEGARYEDSLVVMSLREFSRYFINETKEEE